MLSFSLILSLTLSSTPVDVAGRPMLPGEMLPAPAAEVIELEPVPPSVSGVWRLLQYALTPTPGPAEALAIADLTNDGRAELALSLGAGSNSGALLQVYAGDGLGGLGLIQKHELSGGYGRQAMAIGQFNLYPGLDVAVGTSTGVVLYPGGGGVRPLAPGQRFGAAAVEIAAAINFKERAADALATTTWSSQGSVYQPSPKGLFATPWPVNVAGYNRIGSGDLDADGLIDVVTASGQGLGPSLRVHRNTGHGSLTELQALHAVCPGGTFASVGGVGLGDVDGDGHADVVAAAGGNRPRSCLQIFKGNGKGQFQPATFVPSYDLPGPLAVADLNGDGLSDVVTLHNGWLRLGVYLQQPNGQLGAEQLFPIPYQSWYPAQGLAVADLVGDACLDVAIASSQGLVVLQGRDCALPQQSSNASSLD
ncbi:FG-GAP repeat domain-containing protein [Aquimonas sp.]|jgi:hypothetical protein|uniref:FG-GAP repeat domain-containing protein n=1 Tax=Aquimonas sp. TaxID=1872588 RepID=UPI0037BEC2B9